VVARPSCLERFCDRRIVPRRCGDFRPVRGDDSPAPPLRLRVRHGNKVHAEIRSNACAEDQPAWQGGHPRPLARPCHAGLEGSLHELGGAPPDRTDVGRAGRERRERPVVHRLVAWVAQRHTLIVTEADRVGLTIEISEVAALAARAAGFPAESERLHRRLQFLLPLRQRHPCRRLNPAALAAILRPQRADQTDPLLHTARVTAPERS
jgi:hypothetical protein